jgi:hypothetical protein
MFFSVSSNDGSIFPAAKETNVPLLPTEETKWLSDIKPRVEKIVNDLKKQIPININ